MSQPTQFTITDLAIEFSITPRTIRFWEDQGLISPARVGGRRVYARRDRTRLKLALRGKRLGLSLAEIKQLINLYDADRDDRAQLLTVLAVLDARRNALEQQREDVEVMLAEIAAFEAVCRQALDDEADAIAAVYTQAGGG